MICNALKGPKDREYAKLVKVEYLVLVLLIDVAGTGRCLSVRGYCSVACPLLLPLSDLIAKQSVSSDLAAAVAVVARARRLGGGKLLPYRAVEIRTDAAILGEKSYISRASTIWLEVRERY